MFKIGKPSVRFALRLGGGSLPFQQHGVEQFGHVAGILFAVQEAVDQGGPLLLIGRVHKRFRFVERGDSSGNVHVEASHKSCVVAGAASSNPFGSPLGFNQGVVRVGLAHAGRRRPLGGACQIHERRRCLRPIYSLARSQGRVSRYWKQLDPLPDERNLVRAKLVPLVGRHMFIGIGLNPLEQRALTRPAWSDDRAIRAARQDGCERPQIQACLLLFATMATKAIPAQNRFDVISPHRLDVGIAGRRRGRGLLPISSVRRRDARERHGRQRQPASEALGSAGEKSPNGSPWKHRNLSRGEQTALRSARRRASSSGSNRSTADYGRIAFGVHSAVAGTNAMTLDIRWDSARNFTTQSPSTS